MKRLLIVAALAVLRFPALADDGSVSGIGGTVSLLSEHESVRMVREAVTAKIGWETATVRCEFVFKNEGKATTVKMGFPEDAGGDALPLSKSKFHSFRSWVDGKPAKTTFVLASKEYAGWHVKEVHFAAQQTRKVVEEYTSHLGGDISGAHSFAYILATGRSWKGKIGKATVTVDASEVRPYYRVRVEPKGFDGSNGRFIWKFRDFEPKENISVELLPRLMVLIEGCPVVPHDPKSYAKSGVVMVSISYLKSLQGIQTAWDSKNHACTLTVDKPSSNPSDKTPLHQLKMVVGSRRAILDGTKEVLLPRAPYLAGGQLIIPIVAVIKEIGGEVSIDRSANRIALSLWKS